MMKKLLAAILYVHPILLFSQQVKDTIKPDTILIREVIVLGNLADKSIPVSFQNLSAKDITLNNFGQEPSFILAQTPSISMSSDAGSYWGYSYIRLRGIDQTRINMTLNGVPLNEPEDQGVYFSNYPDFFQSIRNVQIQRGIGMSKNGTSSFAGSILLESELPDTASEYSIYTGIGSFGSSRITASCNTGNKNGFATIFRASLLSSDGYKYHSGNKAKSFFINSTYQKRANLFTITAFVGNQRNHLAWLGAPMDSIRENPRYNRSSNENDNFTQAHVQFHFQHLINNHSKINTCAYYNYLEGNYDFDLNNFLDLPRTNEMYNYALASHFIGWFTNYTINFDHFNLSSGLHINHYTREHIGSEKTLGWLYTNHGNKNEFSGYMRGSYKIGKLSLYADGQYRSIDFKYFGDVHLPVFNWNFFNYNAGFVYKLNERINLFYSFGKINREPTRNDLFLGNDNLLSDSLGNALYANILPERVIDHEFGLRSKMERLSVNVNFYYMSFKNENNLNGEMGPTGLPLHSNTAQSYRSGIELDLKYNFDNGFILANNSSISKNKIRESGESIQPVLSPRCLINQSVIYNYKHISMIVSGRYQSSSFIDYGNMYKIPDFFTFDTKVTYTVKWLQLSFAINNLTNQQYFTNGNLDINNSPVYFVQAPINFYGGIKCTF